MTSRSIFTSLVNNVFLSGNRPLFTGIDSGSGVNFSQDDWERFLLLLNNYSTFLANRQYEEISTDMDAYATLLLYMQYLQSQITNEQLYTIMTITMQALMGAMNVRLLSQESQYQLKTIDTLNKRIQSLLEGGNATKVIEAKSEAIGMTKTFVMKPLYSMYISVYGFPKEGEGFDPVKLNNILNLFQIAGMDPYANS